MNWLGANFLWVLSGSVLLGASSGLLGCFAMLRRRSLVGDALAHATLPGIAIAFMLTGTKSLPVLLIGAVIAGFLASQAIQIITRHSRIKEDTALGLILSVFFAVGIILLTHIQHSGAGNQSGLDKFLFGQAASLVGSDVIIIAVSALVISLTTILLFKEFKLLSFDSQFADGLGFSSKRLDSILMLLIVAIVVIGLQAVGVVLMAAMLIIPPAAARFWTDKLNLLLVVAAIIGGLSGMFGTVLSSVGLNLPTGPLTVISASVMFALSLLIAPQRGLIAKAIRLLKLRRRIGNENSLRSLYEMAEEKNSWDANWSAEQVASHRSSNLAAVRTNLKNLAKLELLKCEDRKYSLTDSGKNEAYRIVHNHRLWEMYLMHQSQIASDHVHRDADDIEHHLSPEIVKQLEDLLVLHQRDLKLPPSVHPTSEKEKLS